MRICLPFLSFLTHLSIVNGVEKESVLLQAHTHVAHTPLRASSVDVVGVSSNSTNLDVTSGRGRFLKVPMDDMGFVLMSCGFFLLIILAVSTCMNRTHWSERIADSEVFFGVPFATFISCGAVHSALLLRNDEIFGTTWTSQFLLRLYVAGQLQRILVALLKLLGSHEWGKVALVCGYHFMCASAVWMVISTDVVHFFAVFALCGEITTIFLNIFYIFKMPLGCLKRVGCLHCATGMILWLSFVVCRLALFPVWLVLFYKQRVRLADALPKFLVVWYISTICILLVLSILWFVPITKGLFKSMAPAKDNRK
uniref:TLC domain-containing protein n=1 Tax=Noctiluca scintillans TaxID=2966 RepID=A0A7S1B0D7_NOCSC|mmetsp:Transcript_7789/g.21340  ORF Transcript_7789/g.21340 Transcript_7789/m.21340 type:complete len:311 (+) Transcript_7789:143-1075(+)